VVNAADMNVPQTRKRLIARAVLDGPVPPLPEKTPWLGWYQAVEDLIPTFPESAFAPWQLRRLPDGLTGTRLFPIHQGVSVEATAPAHAVTAGKRTSASWRAFLVEPDAAGERPPTVRGEDEPCYTLKTSGGGRVHRAFLVGGGSTGRNVPIAMEDEPSITVKANSGGKEPCRAWLEQGRVVALTPRAISRLQTVPEDYELPAKKTLAGTILGNGVPCEMVRRIVAATIGETL
jgi:site-specific DNA-cytosine methylase